jgi:TspO/MBR family protein
MLSRHYPQGKRIGQGNRASGINLCSRVGRWHECQGTDVRADQPGRRDRRRSRGRALHRAAGRQRTALAVSLAVNLSLNAGWNWLFFRLRSPRAGLAGTGLLDLSNADLIRRTARADRAAAAGLAPYAAWCGFATALNAAIARRNR